jgi:hypothetical protein
MSATREAVLQTDNPFYLAVNVDPKEFNIEENLPKMLKTILDGKPVFGSDDSDFIILQTEEDSFAVFDKEGAMVIVISHGATLINHNSFDAVMEFITITADSFS